MRDLFVLLLTLISIIHSFKLSSIQHKPKKTLLSLATSSAKLDNSDKVNDNWWISKPIDDSPQNNHHFGSENFGDIVTNRETNVFVKGNFKPIERLFLTANGNLQRMLSAYFNAPIQVDVAKSNHIHPNTFDREVVLRLDNQLLCHAKGEIQIYDEVCLQAIESKEIGVGQLIRFLGIQPTFQLIAAGKLFDDKENDSNTYCLWRDYELSAKQFRCRFVERFTPNFHVIDL